MRARRGSVVVPTVLVVLALVSTACGDSTDTSSSVDPEVDQPMIVVTTSVLGAVTSDLVGDDAAVVVLIPNGTDPHEYRPSAKDAEALNDADLVVANGLGLEESLDDAIAQAADEGVPVFEATDHIEVRQFGAGDVSEDDHEDEEGDEHGDDVDDPHFWVDPSSMQRVVTGLAPVIETELGMDLTEQVATLDAELAALDAEVESTLAWIPAEWRLLVTGHESMGYFARRYDFALVGALIPSLSSQAAPSAGELAELKEQIDELGVPAIFNEAGTPPALSEAIVDETGVVVVELATHTLPDDGTYATFMTDLAEQVSLGLGSG